MRQRENDLPVLPMNQSSSSERRHALAKQLLTKKGRKSLKGEQIWGTWTWALWVIENNSCTKLTRLHQISLGNLLWGDEVRIENTSRKLITPYESCTAKFLHNSLSCKKKLSSVHFLLPDAIKYYFLQVKNRMIRSTGCTHWVIWA